MGSKVPICTCFPPTPASRQTLIVLEAHVFNSMGVHYSSIRLNKIRLFAPSVDPPILRCRTCTTFPIQPFVHRPGLFTLTYKILTFAIFHKSCVDFGNISDSVNDQYDLLHCSLPSPSLLCQGMSGHHLLEWRLHTSLPPQIPVTLKPTAPMTKFQNGIIHTK